jgi:hypothetical protein
MRGALGEDASRVDANDLGLYRGMDQQGLFDVVGDGEDGGVPGGKLWNEQVAGGAINAGEGFVEDEEVRIGDGKGASQIDTLKFAAGEVAGKAFGERGEREDLEKVVNLGFDMADGEREADVLPDGEVGKDCRVLWSVSEVAAVRRELILGR